MPSERQKEENKAQVVAQFEAMYEELYAWREAHLGASFDEIANQVSRIPMSKSSLAELVNAYGKQLVAIKLKRQKPQLSGGLVGGEAVRPAAVGT
jgi:hypothetical protein